MKRIISCLVCICMMCGLVGTVSFADSGTTVLLSLGFDSMATNTEAFEIKTSNVRTQVCQENASVPDKILKVTKEAKAAILDFALKQEAYSAVFEFEIMLSDEKASRDICIADKDGITAKLFTIGADGCVITDDARELKKLGTNEWHRVCVVCRMGDKRCDVYIDGKCAGTKILMNGAAGMKAIKSFRISLAAGGYGSIIYLDNVRGYKGESLNPNITYPPEAYNPMAVEIKEEAVIEDETSVYINSDFNSDTPGLAPSGVSAVPKDAANKVEVRAFKSDEDKSLLISKSAPGIDAYADFTVPSFAAADSVFEVSFYTEDTDSLRIITVRDENSAFNELVRIAPKGVLQIARKNAAQYEKGKWYDLRLAVSFKRLTIDAWLNGEQIADDFMFYNMDGANPKTIRMQISASSAPGSVYYDNIRFYAGSKFKTPDELTAPTEAEIVQKHLIAPEEEVKALLENVVAMDYYDNKAYAGGVKHTLPQAGAMYNGLLYVPLRFTLEALGGNVEWNEELQAATAVIDNVTATYTAGQKSVLYGSEYKTMDGEAVIIGESLMVPASEFESRLAKMKLSHNKKYGILVLDSQEKEFTSENLKDIYDFITYTRPKAEQILKDFEPMRGVHPRILATQKTFEDIKSNIQSSETVSGWYQKLLTYGDRLLGTPHTVQDLSDGTLLQEARTLLDNSINLAMLYRLTGEEKYFDFLREEIHTVCSYPDWNATGHFLDVAEMTAGVAIAYDWCFDKWTPEEKQLMEKSIMEFALKEGERCYTFNMKKGTRWEVINNNWSMVCNGGLAMGALALMDVYPDYCSMIVETGLHSLENALGEFAPDGAWVEGITYWAYALNYLTYHMAALDSALGTNYGYFATNGIPQAGYYVSHMQGYQGAFNLGDAGTAPKGCAGMFYIAKAFNDPAPAQLRLGDMQMYGISSDVHDILYFEPSLVKEEIVLPLDKMFRDDETVTFRGSWADDTTVFAGIQGGNNDATHGNLDGGTFVLDALGVRWAADLGPDEYVTGYFNKVDGARYRQYMCSSQGQNVLALNPFTSLGQEQYGFPYIEDFVSKPKGGYAIYNMTSAYGNKVISAKRGLMLDHCRTQAVVQDELSLVGKTDLWWFMHTEADVDIAENGKTVILSSGGKRMYMVLQSNAKNARFTLSDEVPLEGSGVKPAVNSISEYKRLQINIPEAEGSVSISVRFIPITGQMMLSSVQGRAPERVIPIENWKVEDGEPDLPELADLKLDGVTLEGFEPDKYSYNVNLPFGYDKIPEISASVPDGYEIFYSQPENVNSTAEVKLVPNGDELNANYYLLSFKVQPLMGRPDGRNKHTIAAVEVSSEPQAANPKSNAIDGDLNTRWSGQGNAEWIMADLGEVKPIDVVTLAFYSGTQRVTYFNIEVSSDGKTWTKVFDGESSGLTDGYESYFIGEQNARYIKMNAFGTSINLWNSFSEIEIYGK